MKLGIAASCVLTISALGAGPVAAEINVADSVEWMTADSDLVVRGSIVGVRTHKGPGGVVWHLATVAVAETLKGAARTRVTIAFRHLHGPTPADWQRGNTELLLYLIDSKRRLVEDRGYAIAPFAIRPDTGSSRSAVALTGPSVGRVFAVDFTVKRKRGAIVGAARRAASAKKPSVRARVDVPLSTQAFKALYAGSAVWLFVPKPVASP